MKYTRVFGDVVAGMAIAVAGAAQAGAQPDDGRQYWPRVVTAVGERIEDKATAPKAAACFAELAVEQKPLSLMGINDAVNVLACTDSKIVGDFLAQPRVHHALLGHTVLRESGYVYTADRMIHDPRFAERVAQECRGQGQNLREFSVCAANVHAEVSKTDFYELVGKAAAVFILAAGIAGYRRERQEMRHARLG